MQFMLCRSPAQYYPTNEASGPSPADLVTGGDSLLGVPVSAKSNRRWARARARRNVVARNRCYPAESAPCRPAARSRSPAQQRIEAAFSALSDNTRKAYRCGVGGVAELGHRARVPVAAGHGGGHRRLPAGAPRASGAAPANDTGYPRGDSAAR